MNLHRHFLSLRGLLQALLALAVLVAPVTANAMEVSSATPASHREEAKAPAHCDGAPDKSSKHEKAAGKTCCASMCMGIAIAPFSRVDAEVLEHVALVSAAPTALIGSPAELATPPPRSA